MKKSYLYLVIAIVAAVIIGAVIYIGRQNKSATSATNSPTSQTSSASMPVAQGSPTTGVKTVTTAEVAKHSGKSDCWVIIGSEVYNVTSVIPNHPGGPEKIIALCGKDATQAFTSREGMGPHPQSAQERLDSLFVGNLAQ